MENSCSYQQYYFKWNINCDDLSVPCVLCNRYVKVLINLLFFLLFYFVRPVVTYRLIGKQQVECMDVKHWYPVIEVGFFVTLTDV
jgi:hypothetical protein